MHALMWQVGLTAIVELLAHDNARVQQAFINLLNVVLVSPTQRTLKALSEHEPKLLTAVLALLGTRETLKERPYQSRLLLLFSLACFVALFALARYSLTFPRALSVLISLGVTLPRPSFLDSASVRACALFFLFSLLLTRKEGLCGTDHGTSVLVRAKAVVTFRVLASISPHWLAAACDKKLLSTLERLQRSAPTLSLMISVLSLSSLSSLLSLFFLLSSL